MSAIRIFRAIKGIYMEKISKKFLSVLLMISMLVPTGVLTVTANSADNTVYYDGVWAYKIVDDYAVMVGVSEVQEGDVCGPPSNLGGYPLKVISGINCGGYAGIRTKQFIIPQGVEHITQQSFNTGLFVSIVIPLSLTQVDFNAFPNCYNFTTVYYEGTEADWNNISIEYPGLSNKPLINAARYYNYKYPSLPTGSPIGKTEYNGHTYGIYTDKISWDEAVEFCESQGGHLATITSEAENNAITSLLSGENTAYWIGAECTNGVWNWITDENWNYTNWGSGEPAFMDEEHLCARINCETTGFIEMRGYEFNYGDWDSCRNFDASKHTIPVGGFICEWEPEKSMELLAGPGKNYYSYGIKSVDNYIPISVENGYCEIEYNKGKSRAYVDLDAIDNLDDFDVFEIKSSSEAFGVNRKNTIIKMINVSFTTTQEIRTVCGPGNDYWGLDDIPVNTNVKVLYNIDDYSCVEYELDNLFKRGYIKNKSVDQEISQNITDKEFDSIKVNNACFIYDGKNVYSAYSKSGSKYFDDVDWKNVKSFSVEIGGWNIWAGIVGAISGNDVDTSEMKKLQPQFSSTKKENVANNINAVFDGLQMIVNGISSADQRINVHCSIQENNGNHRILLNYGSPIEYLEQGNKYTLSDLLVRGGNYVTTEDELIRKWFPDLVSETGKYSMKLNFSENSQIGTGYSLVIKNDGCIYAYPTFKDGTTFPVYHTVNGDTKFVFDAVDIYERVATKIDEKTTKQLLQELQKNGLESSYLKTCVKCPTDIQVVENDTKNILAKTINGNIEVNEKDDVTVEIVDNAKIIRYPLGSNYSVFVDCYGDGNLNCIVENIIDAKISEATRFSDILIKKDEVFVGKQKNNYFSISKLDSDSIVENKILKPYDSNILLTVDYCEGGYVTGIPSVCNEGQLIAISGTAYEGYSFKGWYKDEKLLSENSELVFLLNSTSNIEAKFERIENYCNNGHNKVYNVAGFESTCTSHGLSSGEICLICNTVIVEQVKTDKVSHSDTNNDNKCDTCGELLNQDIDTDCDHLCHSKNEFLSFFWKIYNFLMRLFSMERYCTCGVAHY